MSSLEVRSSCLIVCALQFKRGRQSAEIKTLCTSLHILSMTLLIIDDPAQWLQICILLSDASRIAS